MSQRRRRRGRRRRRRRRGSASTRRTAGTSTTCRGTGAPCCATWRATSSSPASRRALAAAQAQNWVGVLHGRDMHTATEPCVPNTSAAEPSSVPVWLAHGAAHPNGDMRSIKLKKGRRLSGCMPPGHVWASSTLVLRSCLRRAGAVAVRRLRAVGVLLARGGPRAVQRQLPPHGRTQGARLTLLCRPGLLLMSYVRCHAGSLSIALHGRLAVSCCCSLKHAWCNKPSS